MSGIEIFLAKSLLCIANIGCYPVLVGETTFTGTYQIEHVVLENHGKQEDVLMYAYSGENRVQAIHPSTSAYRDKLLKENATKKVTLGCINVDKELFDYLIDCCNKSVIKINP